MFANATAGNMSDLPFEDELDFPDFLLLEDAALLLLLEATFLLELLDTTGLPLLLLVSVFLLLLDFAEELLESTFLLELLDATVPELELDSGGLLPTDISSAASSKTG